MGCFWSSEGPHERCVDCGNRKAVNNLVIIDHRCEVCISQASRVQELRANTRPTKVCFGEYKCSCGHRWNSRRSWAGYSQNCERCRREVYAHVQRELRPSDFPDGKETREKHKKELCQKCRQLGRDCGLPVNRNPVPKKQTGMRSGGMGRSHVSRMRKRY